MRCQGWWLLPSIKTGSNYTFFECKYIHTYIQAFICKITWQDIETKTQVTTNAHLSISFKSGKSLTLSSFLSSLSFLSWGRKAGTFTGNDFARLLCIPLPFGIWIPSSWLPESGKQQKAKSLTIYSWVGKHCPIDYTLSMAKWENNVLQHHVLFKVFCTYYHTSQGLYRHKYCVQFNSS